MPILEFLRLFLARIFDLYTLLYIVAVLTVTTNWFFANEKAQSTALTSQYQTAGIDQD
jgi:hypothetical protein